MYLLSVYMYLVYVHMDVHMGTYGCMKGEGEGEGEDEEEQKIRMRMAEWNGMVDFFFLATVSFYP